MSQLPTIILLAGLLIGAVAAWRFSRSTGATQSKRKSRDGDRDQQLVAADLQLQLDELYDLLRNEGLPEREREALELRAATTLQRLEQLPKAVRQPAPTAPAEKVSPTDAPPSGWMARHPALAGALFGGGMVALVAVLIGLAFRDTGLQPGGTGPAASAPAPASGGMPSANERGEPTLPPFVAQQVDEMRESLVLQPNDIDTRRRLIETLLAAEQHFDAFQEANQLLELSPQDPVGHYAAGFVRYVMGQQREALMHLEQSISSDPSYSQAYLVQGLILMQAEQRDQAIDAWDRGYQASNGQDSRLEHLLNLARQGLSFEEILRTPPGG